MIRKKLVGAVSTMLGNFQSEPKYLFKMAKST